MKCFFHPTVDAVAVCRGCGRAVCRECQQPTVNGELVCGSECESFVKRRALIEQKTIDSMVGNAHACRIASAMLRFASGLALLAAIGSLCAGFLPQPFFGWVWPRNILQNCLEAAGMTVVMVGFHLLAIAMDRVGRKLAAGLDELKARPSTEVSDKPS